MSLRDELLNYAHLVMEEIHCPFWLISRTLLFLPFLGSCLPKLVNTVLAMLACPMPLNKNQ